MRRSHLIILLTLAISLGTPRPASACLWNWMQSFAPIPECPIRDHPTINRVKQVNARITAKLLTIAAKVQEVRTEIEQWRSAYRTARNFEDRLRRVYGDLTANPLPSLVAAYNTTAMASYLHLNADGRFSISGELVDFRESADSLWAAFQDTTNLKTMYTATFRPSAQTIRGEVFGTAGALERQITALGNYERYTRPVLDSIQALGNRTADRYAGRGDVDGDAEARISNLSATLSRLRGTAFETQALGISARIQALSEATEVQHEQSRLSALRATFLPGF